MAFVIYEIEERDGRRFRVRLDPGEYPADAARAAGLPTIREPHPVMPYHAVSGFNVFTTEDEREFFVHVHYQNIADRPDPMQDGALLDGIPLNRREDLALRKAAGSLTDIEALAFAILRGDEAAIPPLLDEALFRYAHGSYTVPVRTIADPRRTRAIIHGTEGASEWLRTRVADGFDAWLKGAARWLALPAGWSIDLYETAEPVPDATVIPDSLSGRVGRFAFDFPGDGPFGTISIDGRPIRNAVSFRVECSADALPRVLIEYDTTPTTGAAPESA